MAVSNVFASLREAVAGKKKYKYSAVPAPPLQEHGGVRPANDHSLRRSRSLKLLAGAAVLLAVLSFAPLYGYVPMKPCTSPSARTVISTDKSQTSVARSRSKYFAASLGTVLALLFRPFDH